MARKKKWNKSAPQRATKTIGPIVPFTLCCVDCDDGMHVQSEIQANLEGWVEIQRDEDHPCANYVGLCAKCKQDKMN